MKRCLFIFILINVCFLTFGQRENTLPRKSTSAATDTIRVVKDNQSALMLRSVLQGAIYDSLAAHTDTLQALRADIDAGGSSLLLDSINAHRLEINDLHDSIAAHRSVLDNHTDSIATHRTALNNAVDSIADHRTDIDSNTATGVINASNISANSVFISVNTTDISSLEDSIAKHTDTLQVHQDQIAALNLANDSTWKEIQVDSISEYTTDNGVDIEGVHLEDGNIRLPTTFGQVQFGGTNNYINGSDASNTINIYTNGSQRLILGSSTVSSVGNFLPTGSHSLGQSGTYWNEAYSNKYYIDDSNTYLDVDGSSNMTFTDAVTGTKTLAELAAAGSPDSSWVSITTDTVKSYGSDIGAYLIFDHGEAGNVGLHYNSGSDEEYIRLGGTNAPKIYTYDSGNNRSSTITNHGSYVTIRHDSILTDNDASINFNGSGFEYFADYSSRWGDRSIPDKEYVDTKAGNLLSASLTDGTPTDAEIDSATGTTPAAVGSGWKCFILDTDGSTLIYMIISDGTSWQYVAMTKAT